MKLFKMLKVQLSGTVLDKVQHNTMLCRPCLNKCIVTISIYFLKLVLLQFSLLNLCYFDQKSTFLAGLKKKNSVKCLSKNRNAGSQNCPLIFLKHISSSFKKKRIKGRGFSGRPIEFHFVLITAINY